MGTFQNLSNLTIRLSKLVRIKLACRGSSLLSMKPSCPNPNTLLRSPWPIIEPNLYRNTRVKEKPLKISSKDPKAWVIQ